MKMDDEVTPKRRRVTQACENCRALKSKVGSPSALTGAFYAHFRNSSVTEKNHVVIAVRATVIHVDGRIDMIDILGLQYWTMHCLLLGKDLQVQMELQHSCTPFKHLKTYSSSCGTS